MKPMRELSSKFQIKPDQFKAVHETIIICLAIVSIVFAIYDIYYEEKAWMNAIDLLIWAIFVVDYSLRMRHARNKWKFFLHNVPDFLTILPFFLFLQVLRTAHVSEFSWITKLMKCFRGGCLLLRILKYCMRIMRTHGIRFVILVTALVVASGGIAIHYAEGLSIVDSLWWAFVTAATVGYGDLSPSTSAGRMVAILLMIMGIGLIGSLTSTITSAFLRTHKKNTVQVEVKEILKAKIDCVESLDEAEVEQLCRMIRALRSRDESPPKS